MNKTTKNEKRVAKFDKRREEGKTYKYQPIPYVKGTKEYNEERKNRAEKNVNHKTPLQNMTSIMKKLENQLAKERANRKERFEQKKGGKKTK